MQPFPRGLEMVAGNSHAVTLQSPNVTQWYCGVLKSAFYGPLRPLDRRRRSPGIPRCAAPTNLELQVNFPDCSDGKATSADHRSHMAYSRGGPVPVLASDRGAGDLAHPALPGRSSNPNVFLSSGGVYSGHADFMDAWKAARSTSSCRAA